MKFAVNYSKPLASLIREGLVEVDLFKCPAWPDTVQEARQLRPAYAHFPLRTVSGADSVFDGERKNLIDWSRIDDLLAASETHYINVHLMAVPQDYPHIAVDSTAPDHIERISADFIRSTQSLVNRYGVERVIVENNPDSGGMIHRIGILPEVITRVIEETGVGLLLDVSHARLSARTLGMDAKDYIAALPTNRIREMHITGMAVLDEYWLGRIESAGLKDTIYHKLAGHMVDHLPLRDEDWDFISWAIEQAQNGAWRAPDFITLEYGGVGGVWEAIGERDVMLEQVPRLFDLIHYPVAT